ncbi:MAG: TIGR02206 family membrane protein [Clostridia bacterium]|nr:TIGR02206 family membrane protein [Clostridia bacterium]
MVYEYYHEGFFGYSLEKDFNYWSLAHFLPIILLCVGIWLTYRYREKIKNCKWEQNIRFIIGAVLIFTEAFYYWRLLYVGNSGKDFQMIAYLPLQVCEWSAFIAAFMVMKKSKHMFDVCYYICLTLGIIPFFMPAVIEYTGPGYARYYQFWLEHLVPVYAVFYMMFVHGFKADYKKIWKPFSVLAVLAVFAIIANTRIEGANFMYLAAGTDGDSIANILPENIWVRLVLYIGILIVLFTLISLPQIISQIRAYKKKKAARLAEENEAVVEVAVTEEKEE